MKMPEWLNSRVYVPEHGGGGDIQMTELAGKCYDETEEYFLLSRQGCVCSPLVYQPNTLTWTTPASIPNVDGHYT